MNYFLSNPKKIIIKTNEPMKVTIPTISFARDISELAIQSTEIIEPTAVTTIIVVMIAMIIALPNASGLIIKDKEEYTLNNLPPILFYYFMCNNNLNHKINN